ncbi:hypothetical protein DOE76_07055 [Leifsonia sp. ku-ls]|nr:hypothetical protein DOE76_07055 [Leifsonia sp. ku-ls]
MMIPERNSMRKPYIASVAALTCGVLFSSLAALPAAASENPSSIGEEFREGLESAATRGLPDAPDALREYDNLSESEHEQFDRALEALASGDVDPAQVPGVEIVTDFGSTHVSPVSSDGPRASLAAATASWSAYCTQRVSLLGVVVTETRVDADFDTGGGKVTGIRNQRARVVTNFQPLTTVDFKEIRKETGTIGTVRALVRVERGPIKGLGSQTENWQALAVNGSGNVTSCRWGY